jgi:hypothetical protein
MGRTAILTDIAALSVVGRREHSSGYARHFQGTAHSSDARSLAEVLQPRDSVVLDFDDVSMLWLSI